MSPDQETLAWLALGLLAELSAADFRKLLATLSTPEAICAASRATLARSVTERVAAAIVRGPDPQLFENTLRWLDASANHVVTFADETYPRLLLQITDPPPLLYVKGNPNLLNHASLAVVGSRNATPQGRATAQAFSQELSEGGFTIVSGMALGIDAA
ncbi:MAG: DNA-processing protein DprA, partial [Betaproteobacteria bacterium]